MAVPIARGLVGATIIEDTEQRKWIARAVVSAAKWLTLRDAHRTERDLAESSARGSNEDWARWATCRAESGLSAVQHSKRK